MARGCGARDKFRTHDNTPIADPAPAGARLGRATFAACHLARRQRPPRIVFQRSQAWSWATWSAASSLSSPKPHEAVAGAVVDPELVFLVELLHPLVDIGDVAGDAIVFAAVEAVDRAGDFGERVVILRRRAVEDAGGRDVGIVAGVGKGLAAAPTEAADGDRLVAAGECAGVGDDGVQVGGDLILLQLVDALGGGIFGGIGVGVAAAGAGAAQQIGRDGDVAGFGELVGDAADPIGKPFVLMDEDDGGGGVAEFRDRRSRCGPCGRSSTRRRPIRDVAGSCSNDRRLLGQRNSRASDHRQDWRQSWKTTCPAHVTPNLGFRLKVGYRWTQRNS